jgi:hypothetical protein
MEGVWLDDVQLADGVVTGSFEQSLWDLDMQSPELPAIEEMGSTDWYQQYKVPVIECRFTIREASALEMDDEIDIVFGLDWEPPRLVFDGGGIAVVCSHPNLELEPVNRVVGYRRLRQWRGGLQSGSEWKDD